MIRASSPIIGEPEKAAMHRVIEQGWLTAGPVNREYEAALGGIVGAKYVRTCNSGSSANLLAIAALSALGYIQPGQKVRVPAMSFPTTVNPLFLYGAVPVLVDVDLETLCPMEYCEVAAHPLGNPVSPEPNLLEDCCDALGSIAPSGKHVGTAGLVGTLSTFPAHHITTGEGGAVWTNDYRLARVIESIRDWGRDCWCEPGANNTCGERFDWHFPPLPKGYDHKYTLTHLGYNLKMTEVQAACGLAQLERLPGFISQRRENYAHLRERLSRAEEQLILPKETPSSQASWFGFPFILRESGLRTSLQKFLLQAGIDSRLLFAGNLARQPYFQGRQWGRSGELTNADKAMEDGLWVGVWPGLTPKDMDAIASAVLTFLGDF